MIDLSSKQMRMVSDAPMGTGGSLASALVFGVSILISCPVQAQVVAPDTSNPANPSTSVAAETSPPSGSLAPTAVVLQPEAAASPDPQRGLVDAKKIEDLQLKVLNLSDEVESLREDMEFQDDRLQQTMPKANLISGYVDFGFFMVQGDGAGSRPDTGYRAYPRYENSGVPDTWVFIGDPLSAAVNSRGEPADTGESRAVVFDSLNSGGGPSFAVNALGINVFGALSDEASVTAMVDITPRSRKSSDTGGIGLGDFIDVKLAYGEYAIVDDVYALTLYAGKFDSVLGVEYRSQDAPNRLGITPSLICRYTCGRPLGIKGRLALFDDLILNVSVTNGSHMMENFPLYNEIDINGMPSVAGRVSLWVVRGAGLDIGVSGSIGPQDFQDDSSVIHRHIGADLRLDWNDLIVAVEFVLGEAEGATDRGSTVACDVADCLRYQGGYAKIAYRMANWFTPYVRGDFRDALHKSGASFIYVSKVWRATGGAQFDLGQHASFKAEYTLNREYSEGPQIENDVFTSSLVLKY